MTLQQKPRILIVEDNNDVAFEYQRILEKIGVSKIAEDSIQFFELVDNFKPQVILLDLILEGPREYEPKRAGIQILEKLKEQHSRWRNVPVIVVTGHIEPDIEARCQELGVVGFLIKPVSIDILRQTVKKHIFHNQE